jgi:hypothetical protein
MGQCWHRLHQTKTHWAVVGGRIQLAALLRICHNSFNGGQTSAYFNVAPMSIGDFLGNRTGTMPVESVIPAPTTMSPFQHLRPSRNQVGETDMCLTRIKRGGFIQRNKTAIIFSPVNIFD